MYFSVVSDAEVAPGADVAAAAVWLRRGDPAGPSSGTTKGRSLRWVRRSLSF